jgi:hypothetical protein
MVAPACCSSLFSVLRCSSLPTPAPIAAPTVVAASECHLDPFSHRACFSCRQTVPGVPLLCDRVQRFLVLG